MEDIKILWKKYKWIVFSFVILVSMIGSFIKDGFYIYGVIFFTIYFASRYKPQKITEKLLEKKEEEEEKLKAYEQSIMEEEAQHERTMKEFEKIKNSKAFKDLMKHTDDQVRKTMEKKIKKNGGSDDY